MSQMQSDMVAMLERLLAAAKRGEFDGIAVAYVGPGLNSGELIAEDLAPVMFQFECLKHSVLSSVDEKQQKRHSSMSSMEAEIRGKRLKPRRLH